MVKMGDDRNNLSFRQECAQDMWLSYPRANGTI